MVLKILVRLFFFDFIDKIVILGPWGKYEGNEENINSLTIKKVPNFAVRDYLCVRCEDGFKNLVMKNYASIFAYVAFFSMNSRRGATSSPISMEKM